VFPLCSRRGTLRTLARLARIVAPDAPHHITARGNRREPIFFEDGDQELYIDRLAEPMAKARVEVWAYCLMPNHVHLIACPRDETGLGRALGAAHRRWATVFPLSPYSIPVFPTS
jgi:putative transposase